MTGGKEYDDTFFKPRDLREKKKINLKNVIVIDKRTNSALDEAQAVEDVEVEEKISKPDKVKCSALIEAKAEDVKMHISSILRSIQEMCPSNNHDQLSERFIRLLVNAIEEESAHVLKAVALNMNVELNNNCINVDDCVPRSEISSLIQKFCKGYDEKCDDEKIQTRDHLVKILENISLKIVENMIQIAMKNTIE